MSKKGKQPLRQPPVTDGVVDDPRFAAMHTAPLFKKLQKDDHKFTVDKRFEAVLKDERFQAPQPKYDKYGRKAKKGAKKPSELEEVYKLEQSNDERLEYLNKLARGEIESDAEDSSEEDQVNEGVEEDESDYDSVPSEDEANTISLININKQPVEYGDATNRLAVMNCDWQFMKAADAFALLQSFCPTGHVVQRVTVYVSDFGAKRLEEEAKFGPQGLWQTNANDDEDDASDAAEEAAEPNDVKLRQYELEKLRYYFAIAICDSVSTANTLYDQLNGAEVGHSSVQLDLRFVPDDVEFTGREVRDEATNLPEQYEPAEFVSQALQSSKVRCTWDEAEADRDKTLTNFAKWRELKDSDFQVYLASSESEGSDDENADAAKMRKLLLGEDDDENEDNGDSFFMNDNDGMNVRSAKKGDAEEEEVHEFTFIPKSRPQDQSKAKKNKKKTEAVEEDEVEKNDQQSPERSKSKKKKGKSKRKRTDDENAEESEGFKVDVHDQRFAALLEGDERFGIDRTNKDFKETDGMRDLLAEQRRRKQHKTKKHNVH